MSVQQRRYWLTGLAGLAIAVAVVQGVFHPLRPTETNRHRGAPSAESPLIALAESLREGDARALALVSERLSEPQAGSAEAKAASGPLSEQEVEPWLTTLTGLRTGFLKFGGHSRAAAVVIVGKMLDRIGAKEAPSRWVEALAPAHDVFGSALADSDLNVRATALSELGRFWSWTPGRTLLSVEEQVLDAWKEAFVGPVVRCLGDREPKVRVAAVSSLGRLPIDEAAAPALAYLEDKTNGTVRQQVLISFAARPRLLSEDAIAKHLYDPEPSVPETAETVLKLRGLTEEQITLARLINNPRPALRASVIPLLRDRTDVDPVVWLTQLSRDDDESVRRVALEALSGQNSPEARDRLNEMAQADRSAAIRQAARRRLLKDGEPTVALPPLPGTPGLNPKAN